MGTWRRWYVWCGVVRAVVDLGCEDLGQVGEIRLAFPGRDPGSEFMVDLTVSHRASRAGLSAPCRIEDLVEDLPAASSVETAVPVAASRFVENDKSGRLPPL